MRQNTILQFLLILSVSFTINAQEIDFENYTPLVSSGEIPRDFLLLGKELFEEEMENYSGSSDRFDRKNEQRFLLESSFLLNEILQSGRILFNDPITQYVNAVADNLLQDNPELLKEIRFFLTKSPSVNAFSTDKGIIFINLGIIAQLSNEAELAFILAHEIIHYVEKHNMEMFVETERIFKGKSSYKYLSLDDKYLARNYRSKESESEADEKALIDFYSKSNYSLDAIPGVFDVLQYSYLPFDEIPFDKVFFETDHIVFPDSWFPAEINPIKMDDDYDDTKSTHPNIRKRKETMRRLIENMDKKERYEYILSKEKFIEVRNIARFEAVRQQLLLHDYGDAIYNSYILLREFPDNMFLRKAIASSLYGLSKYKLYARLRDVLPYEDKVEGQSYVLYYFLNQLSSKEINTLALYYCWSTYANNPEDLYLKLVCQDLFKDIVSVSKLDIYDFSRKSKVEKMASYESKAEEVEEEGSKYSRIKKQREQETFKDDEWITYAFVDLFEDKDFVEEFSLATAAKTDDDDEFVEETSLIEDLKEQRRIEREERIFGKSLGINKVVLIDPIYMKVDNRKQDNVLYIDSEANLQLLYSHLNFCAEQAGIELELISSDKFQYKDTEKFNDLALIKEWMTERFDNEETEMVLSDFDVITKIAEKYETQYIGWTGVIQLKETRDDIAYRMCLGMLIFPLLPYEIIMALTPEKVTYLYFILMDVKTGEFKFVIDDVVKSNATNDILKSKIYDIFFQISKSPKNAK